MQVLQIQGYVPKPEYPALRGKGILLRFEEHRLEACLLSSHFRDRYLVDAAVGEVEPAIGCSYHMADDSAA